MNDLANQIQEKAEKERHDGESGGRGTQTIPDPEVQGYAIIAQITGKIIEAIPDGVLVNDDDFVDVFYTLMQDT